MEDGTFSWDAKENSGTVLRNITLKIQPGQLIAVVGAIGSGKSSLISAFLGEMDKISGYVNTKLVAVVGLSTLKEVLLSLPSLVMWIRFMGTSTLRYSIKFTFCTSYQTTARTVDGNGGSYHL
ncbi:Canalicular multispecific organic anion transporter 1 [Homalodisca vitripennis]|nr:Canalicular multispecific organic anion transporter 1 [Homalodisca vitripennis]